MTPEYQRKWRAANRDRVRANDAAWRRANPDKARANKVRYRTKNRERLLNERLQQLYGMTLEQRDAMLRAQGNRCAICTTTTPRGKGWVIDHDHVTGRVRGVLCTTCNSGIGHLQDSLLVLKAAVIYLEAK